MVTSPPGQSCRYIGETDPVLPAPIRLKATLGTRRRRLIVCESGPGADQAIQTWPPSLALGSRPPHPPAGPSQRALGWMGSSISFIQETIIRVGGARNLNVA